MAKAHPTDFTDDTDHPGNRKFHCNHNNTVFIYGTDFDDKATVTLEEIDLPDHVWSAPSELHVIAHGTKLKVKAYLTCPGGKRVKTIGQLTVTVTNPSSTPGSVTKPSKY